MEYSPFHTARVVFPGNEGDMDEAKLEGKKFQQNPNPPKQNQTTPSGERPAVRGVKNIFP